MEARMFIKATTINPGIEPCREPVESSLNFHTHTHTHTHNTYTLITEYEGISILRNVVIDDDDGDDDNSKLRTVTIQNKTSSVQHRRHTFLGSRLHNLFI
jgi:hypothetical protein